MSNNKEAEIPKYLEALMWDYKPSSYNAMPDATHNRQILEAYEFGRAALTAEVAALKAQVARLSAPVTEELYDDGRCQICGWPLSKIMEDGCVPESCSMRAREGSEDWFRLKKRREWLAARATPPQDVEKGVKQ